MRFSLASLIVLLCIVATTPVFAQVAPIALSTTSVVYGTRAVGSASGVRTITLTSGMATLNIGSVTLGGAQAGDFNLTNGCGATLALGASCTLSVTVTPGAAGLRTASITVASDAAGSPHTVTLAGMGRQGSVAAGLGHSLALRSDGSVWGWGGNQFGELGDGTGLSKSLPVQVMAPGSGVIDLVAGTHSLALKSDGTVWAWGYNYYGQLGDGSTANRNSPQQVSGLAGVVAIAAGRNHSLALKSDGSVWAWGNNSSGQLGDGTSTLSSAPVQVQAMGPGSGVVALQASDEHTLALKSDGSVWAWGNNHFGQLGDGTGVINVAPVQVMVSSGVPLTGVAQLAAGYFHSLALKSDGSVWGWGNNGVGQLGMAKSLFNFNPVQSIAAGSGVILLAAGSNHSLLLKSDGSVWTTGHNFYGQLGIGTSGLNTEQFAAAPVIAAGSGAVALAGNEQHSLVLKSDGSVTAWGGNGSSQLGDGSTTPRLTPMAITLNWAWASFSPSSLSFTRLLGSGASTAQTATMTNASGGGVNISSISASGDFSQSNTCGATLAAGASCTIAVTFTPTAAGARSGSITITSNVGVRNLGLGGDALAPATNLSPASISFGTRDVGTTSGVQAITLTNSGTATLNIGSISLGGTHPGDFNLTSGCGATLAIGSACTLSVTTTPGAAGSRTASIIIASDAVGSPHTVSLSSTGNLAPIALSTTSVVYGTRAVGSASGVRTITLTSGMATLNIGSVTLGGAQAGDFNLTNGCGATLALGASCTLSVTVTPGAAGLRTASITVASDAAGSPHTVTLAGMGRQGSVAAGLGHSLALRSDGSVWGWGGNQFGELGDGTGLSKSLPVQVMAPGSGVIDLVAGTHSLALKSDGTVWAWGYNYYGQLGDGSTANRNSPQQVSGLAGVVAIAAGRNHSLALKSDGSVWAWGNNSSGQLGDGTSTLSSAPVQVQAMGPGSGVVALQASDEHTLALKSDGSVWAWGNNHFGQLGDGTGVINVAPVQVMVSSGVPLTGVAQLAAGYFHSLALKSDGSVWGWGNNGVGQLGMAKSLFNFNPVQSIAAGSGVILLAAGSNHSLLLKSDGSVWTTGHNFYGQLGIGTSGLNTEQFAAAPVIAAGSGAVALAGNEQHSLVLKSDGSVTAWGGNGSSQLGDGSTTPRLTPMAINSLLPAVLGLNRSSLTFTSQLVGTPSSAQTITITNNNSAVSATISSISASGDFAQSNDCGTTLAGGASCIINVTFTPTAAGARSGNITITSDASGSPHATSLSGTGAIAAVATIPQAGLRVWLKADTGLELASSPTPSSVTQWLDQSGNGINLRQTAASKRPVMVTSTPNGMPAVRFDGLDDYLETAAPVNLLSGGAATVFLVVRPGAAQNLYADILDYSHATWVNFVVQQDGSVTNSYIFNDGTTAILSPAYLQVYTSSFQSGGPVLARINGGNETTGAAPPMTLNQPNYFTLGSKSLEVFSRQWNGDLAEVILYDRVLAGAERASVEAYLLARYGLDTDPDLFSLGSRAGVALGSQQVSDTVTVTGINTAAPISVSGGAYSINGAAFTSVPGQVTSGQQVRVRLISSGTLGTIATATLSIGGVSAAFNVNTAADIQAPTVPGGLTAVAVSASQINLSWSTSSDNLAVSAYQVFRSGVFRATTNAPALSFSDTGLAAATNYSYTMAACDATGNCSAQSGPVSATTMAGGSTYTANLEPGFNLIGNSLNLTLDVAAVFGNQDAQVPNVTPNIASIWKWNAIDARWAFYSPLLTVSGIASFAASRNFDVLAAIGPGEGYWINAINQFVLPAQTGSEFTWNGFNFSALPSGFNLIAHASVVTPGQFNADVSQIPPAAGTVPTDNFLTLWAWDAAMSKWYFYSPLLETSGGLPAVKTYADGKFYLHFQDAGKTLGIGTGFWVNRP